MKHFYADSEGLNVSSAIVPTHPNITTNSHNIVKQMRKLTLLDSKLRKTNYVFTHSSAPTVEAIIKLIKTHAPSESIVLIAIGTTKNNMNFTKVEAI